MVTLKWDLTSRCNMACHHCYNHDPHAGSDIERKRDLTTGEITSIIRRFEGQVKLVQLLGGEPLCHPDFFRIIEEFNRAGAAVQMNTNALALDEDAMRRILGLDFCRLVVGLDGPDALTNDAIRGAGTFDRVLGNVERALELRERARPIHISIHYTVTATNMLAAPRMIPFCQSLGLDDVYFLRAQPLGLAAKNELDVLIDDDQWFATCERIAETAAARPGKTTVWVFPPAILLNDYLNAKYGCSIPIHPYTCTGASAYFYIRSNGETFPCGKGLKTRALRHAGRLNVRANDVLHMGLDELLSSPSFRAAFAFYHDETRRREYQPCNRCRYRSMCDSCPVEMEFGRLVTGSETCVNGICLRAEQALAAIPRRGQVDNRVVAFPEPELAVEPAQVIPDSVPRRNPRANFAPWGDGLKLYTPATSEYLSLNAGGTCIWDLIDGTRSVEEIARAVSAAGEVSMQQAREWVSEFIGHLVARGAVLVPEQRAGAAERNNPAGVTAVK